MRILVSTIAAVLGVASVASAQPPWPVNPYGAPYPQPNTLMPRVSPNYGYMHAPPNPAPGQPFYFNPMNPAYSGEDPNPGGWKFNYTPINPLAPRGSAPALPTYSSGPFGGGPVAGGSRPAWPAPGNAPEARQRPAYNDPNADLVRMPVEFHRPTNERFWFGADYTMAFLRPVRLPPLASTGPLTARIPGVIGEPGTQVLFGGDALDFNMFSGFRLTGGVYLDDSDCCSLELGVFYLAPNTQQFRMQSDVNGNPTFGRPFFVAADGINREGTLLTAFPGLFSGSLSIDAKTQMHGVEFNARYHGYGYYKERLRWDGLVGFRYLRFYDSLEFQDKLTPITRNQLTFLGANVNLPNQLQDRDLFQASNNFYGPQIGARVGWEEKWVVFDGFFKLALGATEQRVNIDGSTTLVTPTGNTTVVGGVLAQPSNIGRYTRTVFGIVPEFGANFGVNVTDNVRLKLGYSFLMWSHVARAGTQIDRNINPGQIAGAPAFGTTTGPAVPAFRFNDEFFWSHFLNVGLEVHY